MHGWNYDLSAYYCVSQQNCAEDELKFRSTYKGDCYATKLSLSVHESFSDLIRFGLQAFKLCSLDGTVMSYDARTASIKSENVFMTIDSSNTHHSDIWKPHDRWVHFGCMGNHDDLEKITNYLKDSITQSSVPVVTWEFIVGDERRSQEVQIQKAKPIFNEFYPWLGDVTSYFDEFIASESSILVLLGPTGTAKTSFIRSLIWHGSMNTMFTYEEKLLGSDSLFVDFIVNEDTSLLVVEDADLLLTNREHDGNKIMSKFLNVGDGLASISKKKIVFTANITDLARIDNALLRPGRCFDCQVFRPLTFKEACAAAMVAGIPLPEANKAYTLAELFALSRNDRQIVVPKSVGFAT